MLGSLALPQNWLLLFAYVLSGLLYNACYSHLVFYSNPVVTSLSPLSLTPSSVVQVLAFFVTLAVMWAYENAHVAVWVATYA